MYEPHAGRASRPGAAPPGWRPRSGPFTLDGGPVSRYDATPPFARATLVAGLAGELLAGVRAGRTRAARRHTRAVLETLLRRGLEHAARSGQWRAAEVAVHVVQVQLAVDLWPQAKPDTARRRVSRALRRLASAGVLRYRAHVGNVRGADGRVLYDGTVVRLRLTPGLVGRFLPEDFSHPWRDLERAMELGDLPSRLLGRELSHDTNEDMYVSLKHTTPDDSDGSMTVPEDSLGTWDTSLDSPARDWLDELLASASDRGKEQEPAGLYDQIAALEYAPEARRHLEVSRVAAAMARELRDEGSKRYFAGLLWKALRAGRLQPFAQQVARLLGEVAEGGVRKPGALLAARYGKLVA